VKAYLPPSVRWYEVKPQLKIAPQTGQVTIPDSQPNGPPPIHIRDHSIIPMVTDSQLISTSQDSINIIDLVALPCHHQEGSGELFWDDRESIGTIESKKFNLYHFEMASNCSMVISVEQNGYSGKAHPELGKLIVVNTVKSANPIKATLDGKEVSASQVNGNTEIILGITLGDKLGQKYVVEWAESVTKKCDLQ
jgi:alpha-glucosidase (family GH31 glycosyl hydrolase)